MGVIIGGKRRYKLVPKGSGAILPNSLLNLSGKDRTVGGLLTDHHLKLEPVEDGFLNVTVQVHRYATLAYFYHCPELCLPNTWYKSMKLGRSYN